jgi:hypothetical protein
MSHYTDQMCSTHMNAVIRSEEIEVVIHTDYIIQCPTLLRDIKMLLRSRSANGLVGVEQGLLMPWELHGIKFTICVSENFSLHNEIVDQVWQLVEEHISTFKDSK